MLLVVMGVAASPGYAEGMYVSGSAGMTFLDDSSFDDGFDTGKMTFDPGFGTVGALGVQKNMIRVEAEIGFRGSSTDKVYFDGDPRAYSLNGDLFAMSLMANAYYDLHFDSKFSPFIGAGAGVAYVDLDLDNTGSADDTVFAYQFMGGISYAINRRWNIDVQYRYFATSDPDLDGQIELEYASYEVLAGFRFSFK